MINEVFTGRVFRISPTINSVTRSFIAELELPNRNDLETRMLSGFNGPW
jgi:hypothetical protein